MATLDCVAVTDECTQRERVEVSGFALRGGSLSAGAEVVWDAMVLETAFTTSSEGRRGSLRFIGLRSLRRPVQHLLGAVLLPTWPRTGQLQVPENQCLGKEGATPPSSCLPGIRLGIDVLLLSVALSAQKGLERGRFWSF